MGTIASSEQFATPVFIAALKAHRKASAALKFAKPGRINEGKARGPFARHARLLLWRPWRRTGYAVAVSQPLKVTVGSYSEAIIQVANANDHF